MNLLFACGLLFGGALAQGSALSSYNSHLEKSATEAETYQKTGESMARYLGLRDVPGLLEKYVPGKDALDYGCGTGISSQFLRDLGFSVVGVDVSREMLGQARAALGEMPLHLVQNGVVPIEDASFDLVFSSFVLLEIGSMDEIVVYLKEGARLLRDDGAFVLVVGSEEAYSWDWACFGVDYPENQDLQSGDMARVLVPDAGIEIVDYFWTEEDYASAFEEAGLKVVEKHYPLGRGEEPFEWKDELVASPFVVYVLKKTLARGSQG